VPALRVLFTDYNKEEKEIFKMISVSDFPLWSNNSINRLTKSESYVVFFFQADKEDSGRSTSPLLPAGLSVWKPFPSVSLPEGFVETKVKEYFRRLPRLVFSYTKGVQALNDMVSDDEESDSEPFVQEDESDFSQLCKRAVENCIARGKRYFRSGRVLTVQDCTRDANYFLRSQVLASMELELRTVTATILQSSGDIVTASCSCKAKALNRCGHIAAVLTLVLDHVKTAGHEGDFRSISKFLILAGKKCKMVATDPGNLGKLREF